MQGTHTLFIASYVADTKEQSISDLYLHQGMVQLNLNLTEQYTLNATHFSFYKHASMHVHARLMSKLLFTTLVYALDVCMIVWQMHAYMSGTYMPNFDFIHFGSHKNCS